MSDFDKEAEREKLREKYEREEERRETTEQMSELLLKGATMTNAHCSDCGDPIFRYDGQEFCPTCQKPVDRGARAAEDEDPTGASDQSSGTADATNGDAGAPSSGGIEVTAPSDEARVQFGGDGTDESDPSSADDTARASGSGSDVAPGTADAERHAVPSAAPAETSAPEPATGTTEPTGSGGSAEEHLARARVVLAQTVERHARRAAAADAPREARDHLETAREAAETLGATEF